MDEVKSSILKKVYPKRSGDKHKGQFGKLLLVSGSKMHTGSPVFSAMAAYRTGCDLVYLACPERAANVAASYSPNLITLPLKGDCLTLRHCEEVFDLIKTSRIDALLIGPGLWRAKETFEAIYKIIKEVNLPMVIDADAIRAIGLKQELLKDKKVVLTPHANEFLEISDNLPVKLENRIEVVKQSASKLNSVIVLKGKVDIISNGVDVSINKTGSAYMTKGGFGDTLAGICAGLLARKVETFNAACASTYINGKAGELLEKEFGESMLASDLLDGLPKVIKA